MRAAWLFPGQGAQLVGMGRDLCDASPAARGIFARADAALGESLSRLCFDGPIETLTLTANTQPAVLATSLAVLAALRERHPGLPLPVCAAGHSLGEYSALVAAGAIELEDGVRLCRLRGAAMQQAAPLASGAMSAIVGLDAEVVERLCAEVARTREGQVVSPANFNAPDQTVIAGHASAVAAVEALAWERGARSVALKVSAPFHCSLMAPARQQLDPVLRQTRLGPLRFPVLANVDAEPRQEPETVREALLRQLDSPVQWVGTLRRLGQLSVTHVLEIGPGRVLAGLVKRTARDIEVLSVGTMAAIAKVPAFLGLELGPAMS
ncbi:MAG: ACP S-malonyltransferase [Deltaproteobacteria bacterium]|nr:ACP S-malonyltransferase [Deltaproteobacteria bacterium]